MHKDDIEALRYIYNSEDGKLSHAVLQDLKSKLSAGLEGFGISRLWNDYALVQDDDTEVAKTTKEEITELIQLVRFAYGMIKRLVPLTSNYAQRFELWCGQKQRDLPMTPAQRELFKKSLFISPRTEDAALRRSKRQFQISLRTLSENWEMLKLPTNKFFLLTNLFLRPLRNGSYRNIPCKKGVEAC